MSGLVIAAPGIYALIALPLGIIAQISTVGDAALSKADSEVVKKSPLPQGEGGNSLNSKPLTLTLSP
jgi:hypothetical protein